MKLYWFNWNCKMYMSNSREELEQFAAWLNTGFSRVLDGGETTWKIRGIEKGPAWIPVPVFDTGQIEYEKRPA